MNLTFEVREATTEDAVAMAVVSEQSLDLPWQAKDFADAVHSPQALAYVAADANGAFGYVVLYHAADEGEIPSVAVDANHRRCGAARRMMEAVFADAAKRGVRKVFLEVRQSNAPALALYEHMGFLRVGVRKNFYSNPTEDACLMMCLIG
ncbi:MAG: ribosomal protein S18-alanine N-acetyltransferase [Lachnospiraceae bacterium]|nr:ribosomal protein S18-alanine N-acetyltransferase [Lachnospiraceae bacterium]MBQ1720553.1 ribosomal protein S18-alanine N-acetyltransferase [Lachnospiraceae bacterium]MBQ2532960.1 ribosomal protein S18-alanine N-acetyltransferase [Lachnospiraceae bacterium]MBQ2578567.1 ribosomal protein S18-alanine N-acetyltransferase [Lachnospiraceae bacterium]